MNAPLSLFLTSFTAVPRATLAMGLPDVMEMPPPSHEIDDRFAIPVSDFDMRLEAARVEADRLHADAIESLRRDHEATTREAIEAARTEWVESEGQRLTALLDESLATLKSGLETQIANVLRPFLETRVLQATVMRLVDVLDRLLADPRAPIIQVRGPADLLERLAQLRPETGIGWTVADGPEVEITADAARIETRLAAALSAIAQTED